jgi:excinuclease ABC subunit A
VVWDDERTLNVLIDRAIIRSGKALDARTLQSVEQGLRLSGGVLAVQVAQSASQLAPEVQTFQTEFACLACGLLHSRPTPQGFSFNHALGACPLCEGYGRIIGLDLDKVVPNHELSLAQGAVHPFTTPANAEVHDWLMADARAAKVRTGIPYKDLSDDEKRFVLDGAGAKGDYPGVRGFFEWMESKKYKVHVRVMLAKYRGYYPCPDCHGARLKPESLVVTVTGQSIWNLQNLPLKDLAQWCQGLELPKAQQDLSARLIEAMSHRLAYLTTVGLGYLTLARQSRTLSGGESQRIHLATALGSGLTETLYVLDEPTVGLHPRDTQRLLGIMLALRDKGNTLVVVEHDPDVMAGADHILDIGPQSGEHGGRVVFEGTFQALLDSPYSMTGQWLQSSAAKSKPVLRGAKDSAAKPSAPTADNHVTVVGATGNNLKNLTVSIPKDQLVCVTGVSGSGKSTLIKQTLFANVQHQKGQDLALDAAPCQLITGLESFADVLLIDQSPPGRSSRSNPVTYVKAYDDIRQLFASTRQAKVLGLKATDFSFNTPGGRCEACEGLGTQTIDMQFMADVEITCPDCRGQRFQPSVLEVLWHPPGHAELGVNITDVLNWSVDAALAHFASHPKIVSKLQPLQALGLGYLRLGQSTATLSGGEAQRLKLCSYLKDATHPTRQAAKHLPSYLFLFDEPTTGLHLADVAQLIAVLKQLVAVGHSVVVVEHHLDLIRAADWVIDIGPEGGDEGGRIVAEGLPIQIAQCAESITGQYLAGR